METSITMDIPINEEQDLCLNTFGHSVTSVIFFCKIFFVYLPCSLNHLAVW